jgi:NAD(P)-dependent dehydrogenase (short-subunit alcohol dehydrogenase family)
MGLATARISGRTHHLVIADVNEDALERASSELRALNVTSEVAVCDVTDRVAVDRLATQARAAGDVRSVIHTAGLSPSMANVETILRVNALGTVHMTDAFLADADDGFAMVNVASSAGHLPAVFPIPRRTYRLADTDPARFLAKLAARCELLPERLRPGLAYSLSKNFVIWWSRRRTGDFGARGARIMSVSPGSFDTGMGRLEESSGAGALAQNAALHRFGRVEEIAAVLAFCASDQPGYLTGTDLLVDGGADATMGLKEMIAMARRA